MNLHFDEALGKRYKSKTQKIRVMSENWVEKNMFCPCCGNPHISAVVENYAWIKRLETQNINSRSWLFDVLNCVNNIESSEFCLQEIYAYIEILQEKHINNHNVEAKIRQQLQFLRDRGFVEFLGRGHYKKRY